MRSNGSPTTNHLTHSAALPPICSSVAIAEKLGGYSDPHLDPVPMHHLIGLEVAAAIRRLTHESSSETGY